MVKAFKKVIAAILILACIAAVVFIGLKIAGKDSKAVLATTKFGFEDIGEFAAEEYYFTKVESYEGDPLMLFGKAIPFTTSKIIYSVDGYVKAGCDFSEIKIDQNKSKKKVTIDLPEMKILDVKADLNTIKIFDERNCIFNPLDGAETFASATEIENEAKADALNSGILIKAKNNIKTMLESIVRQSVGDEYEIIIK